MKQYIVLAVIIAGLFGLYKWEGAKVKAERLRTEALKTSLTMADAKLQDAEAVNRGVLDQLAKADGVVTAAAQAIEAARKRERKAAAALANLKKDIEHGSENVPVPDALQRVLDAWSVRSAVPQPSEPAADRADESGDAGTPGVGGPELPPDASSTPEAGIEQRP